MHVVYTPPSDYRTFEVSNLQIMDTQPHTTTAPILQCISDWPDNTQAALRTSWETTKSKSELTRDVSQSKCKMFHRHATISKRTITCQNDKQISLAKGVQSLNLPFRWWVKDTHLTQWATSLFWLNRLSLSLFAEPKLKLNTKVCT